MAGVAVVLPGDDCARAVGWPGAAGLVAVVLLGVADGTCAVGPDGGAFTSLGAVVDVPPDTEANSDLPPFLVELDDLVDLEPGAGTVALAVPVTGGFAVDASVVVRAVLGVAGDVVVLEDWAGAGADCDAAFTAGSVAGGELCAALATGSSSSSTPSMTALNTPVAGPRP